MPNNQLIHPHYLLNNNDVEIIHIKSIKLSSTPPGSDDPDSDNDSDIINLIYGPSQKQIYNKLDSEIS